jgi:transposase-like protein
MSEEEAYWTFQRIRWHEHDGQPHCPRCNCDDLYVCKAEDRWKCKGCGYRFSVTSGTIFASRKMAIRDILAAIAIAANGEKRISALQMSRELGVTYKTALDLAHRIRGSTPRATGRRLAKSELQSARRPEAKSKAVKACP